MRLGIDRVAALEGGWAAWQAAGYPSEGKQAGALATAAAPGEETGGLQAAFLGNAGAPVTVVEFSDFQCGYCRQHALETLPRIVEAYVDSGQVRYVWRDLPLEVHANAQTAAEAARCAGAQGAFWAMHDRLFEAQAEWSPLEGSELAELLAGYAAELDLDTAAFDRCLETGEYGPQVRQDAREGGQAGLNATPAFLIDGQLLTGAQPFERFQEVIDAALGAGQ
jgi:protein-disulfide isomerase